MKNLLEVLVAHFVWFFLTKYSYPYILNNQYHKNWIMVATPCIGTVPVFRLQLYPIIAIYNTLVTNLVSNRDSTCNLLACLECDLNWGYRIMIYNNYIIHNMQINRSFHNIFNSTHEQSTYHSICYSDCSWIYGCDAVCVVCATEFWYYLC